MGPDTANLLQCKKSEEALFRLHHSSALRLLAKPGDSTTLRFLLAKNRDFERYGDLSPIDGVLCTTDDCGSVFSEN